MRDKLAKLSALGVVAVIVASASIYGDRRVSDRVVVIDSAAACQEDEVFGWVANDTRGCVNYDELAIREVAAFMETSRP